MTMKWEQTAFKNPLARARGLGSAKSGVHHWKMQKLTAVANIPLVVWMIFSVVSLAAEGATFDRVTGWLHEPVNAILLILFLVSSFYHLGLGLQVPVEDYVHHEGRKTVFLLAVKLGVFALAVAAIFSALRVAF